MELHARCLWPMASLFAFSPFPTPPPKKSRLATKYQGHHTRASLSVETLACNLLQLKDAQESKEIYLQLKLQLKASFSFAEIDVFSLDNGWIYVSLQEMKFEF